MSKVVLLAPTPPPIGGIAAWTVRMMNAKLPNNWMVEVVDEKIIGNREFFGDNKRLNIKNELVRCIRIWRGLNKALNDPDAKVVHACIAANTLPVIREYICACITKMRKRRFIIHFRCTVPNSVRNRVNLFFVKILCNKADCIMLLNQKSVDYVSALSKTNTCLIPNFIESDEISHQRNISEKIHRILYVGGVVENKGCLEVMELAKHFPEIEFKFVGNPENNCVEKARSIPNVTLAGVMDHQAVKQEMLEADVFIFLSYFRGEGFSNSLVEAMATGLPCIVSDWAANKDMIEGKGGIVVPIHGVDEAIEAIKEMHQYSVRK